MKPLIAVILAAGKSTRMKSDIPKVLHLLGGVPILQWVVDLAMASGASGGVVVVGHKHEAVIQAFGPNPPIGFVLQQPQLGTGHALMQTREPLKDYDGDILVLCGDVPLLRPNTVQALVELHRGNSCAATVLTAQMPNPTGYGRIVRGPDGALQGIVEERDADDMTRQIQEVNSGTYIFDARKLFAALDQISNQNAQGEYYLTDVVRLLAESGELVAGAPVPDFRQVVGINNRVDLSQCEAVVQSWVMAHLMENGITIVDPSSTRVEIGCEIAQDTIIHPYTVIRSGVKIGAGCEIGPFAHLRPGTVVGNQCKVGAFVEAKNAVFGDETKAGHLAYLGDVTMGRDVNIGAGTIVANYDGTEKHKTEIGDQAFIGCGTVLVAPVKIGARAQTGANTVVPKKRDVPPDTVVVGAPARILRMNPPA